MTKLTIEIEVPDGVDPETYLSDVEDAIFTMRRERYTDWRDTADFR